MIKIDNEFKKLIPPLSGDEFRQLEENILNEGIREKIILWQGMIIDGHNRYEIAQKHGLEFETMEKEFSDRDSVKIWIIDNQSGRRNLSDFVKYELKKIKIEILRKRGEENKEKYNGRPTEEKLLSKVDNGFEKHDTRQIIADELGWSTGKTGMADIVDKKAPEEIKEKLRREEMSINQAYKEIKQAEKKQELEQKKQEYAERVQEISLLKDERKIDLFDTDKKFRIIYADPPWSYNDKCEAGAVQSGGVEVRHYDVMSIDQLCDLPVEEITEKNSVLFMWVTSPLLDECFDVIKSWGFKYKASFVWDKVSHNMGHYNSVRHEFLLICTKGSCLPDEKKLIDSVQSIEKTNKHSQKPIEFMNIIDELYTHGDRIELFCREAQKENWFFWGNEV